MDEEERLQDLVDQWQGEENIHYSKALSLMHEIEVACRRDRRTSELRPMREALIAELREMANAARYSGQAFGLMSGEEPPEP